MDENSSRPVATTDDFTLPIEEVVRRYERAGHPRTMRSIQRYCARGDLECLRQETPFGEKYLVTPASVVRHLAQIAEISGATGRDMTWPSTSKPLGEKSTQNADQDQAQVDERSRLVATLSSPVAAAPPASTPPTAPDMSRHDAANLEYQNRYIERLEGEAEFLREEITTKNAQIKELTERSRETNVLIGGLQKMLIPLLGKGTAEHREQQGFESSRQH